MRCKLSGVLGLSILVSSVVMHAIGLVENDPDAGTLASSSMESSFDTKAECLVQFPGFQSAFRL
jgi:hypothetical protein